MAMKRAPSKRNPQIQRFFGDSIELYLAGASAAGASGAAGASAGGGLGFGAEVAGAEAAGGGAPSESITLRLAREEKTVRKIEVIAKIIAAARVIFCARVVAPVAPKTEFDPPPPKAPPKDPDFESCSKIRAIRTKAVVM